MSRHEPVIVVGVDRSRHSRAALRWAAEETVRRQAGLRIVHVWQSGSADVRPRLPESSSSRRLQAARLLGHYCVSNAICPVVAVPSQMVERVKTAAPIPRLVAE